MDNCYSSYLDKVAKSKARAAKKLSLASVASAVQGAATSVVEQAQQLVNGNANGSAVANGSAEEKKTGISEFDYVCLHR